MQSALTCAHRLATGPFIIGVRLEVTEIVCVQNSFSLADRTSLPVLHECVRGDIAFVPLALATTRWHNLARYSGNPSARVDDFRISEWLDSPPRRGQLRSRAPACAEQQ
jgi:hypothetical protein